MKLNFRIQDEKEVAALLARKGLKAPVVYDVDDDDEDYNEPESSWEGDDQEEERSYPGLATKAPGNIRKAHQSNLNQRMKDAIAKVFFMEREGVDKNSQEARRWVQKRQKTE